MEASISLGRQWRDQRRRRATMRRLAKLQVSLRLFVVGFLGNSLLPLCSVAQLVVEREWEADLVSPEGYVLNMFWSTASLRDFGDDGSWVTLQLRDQDNGADFTTYYQLVWLSGEQEELWRSPVFDLPATLVGFNGTRFIVSLLSESDVLFYEKDGEDVSLVARLTEAISEDETFATANIDGGLVSVDRHEDYPSAARPERDRALTAVSVSTSEETETSFKLHVRHLRFGADAVKIADAPGVVTGVVGSNVVLRWETEIGFQYRVMVSHNLEMWEDREPVFEGTGGILQWAEPLDELPLFARVVQISED